MTEIDKDGAIPGQKSSAAEWREYGLFLLKLAAIVLIFRSFLFAPFNIPSESMQPRLLIGDYLVVSKWPYGFSRYSLPFSPNLFEGRIFGSIPERGDVIVFRPPGQNNDYIKRLIGLPGDIVQMRAGVLEINGRPVPKKRIADLIVPVTQNMIDTADQDKMSGADSHPCWKPSFEERAGNGERQCRFPRFRETLPNGASYDVLDLQDGLMGDDTQPFVIPEGHLFFMGDNRDRSADSRFPADGIAIGMVPIENVIGRAEFVVFSTDGSARWILPWTWFSAARGSRMFKGI
ncbi:MAG: signal peptidase I [Sphingorhabdus sp.]